MLPSHPRISSLCSPSTVSSHLLHQRNPFSSHKPFILKPQGIPKSLILITKTPISLPSFNPSLHFSTCRSQIEPISLSPTTTTSNGDPIDQSLPPNEMGAIGKRYNKNQTKSFWGAVGLIIGTAVGPGMLGLPSATIRSGPIPSTVAIILSWVYVVSSIVLVAELSFAAMEEDGVEEVSFTALATNELGPNFGAFVAVVYASLSFALLIACVSGIGSLIVQQFPIVSPVVAHAIFPCFVGIVIGFFPFKAIDVTNRLLCILMLFSITALVAVGVSIGRSNLLGFLAYANWRLEAILPAIPVTVLTLGFHVITPFICKIAGDSIYDASNAILLGGAVPLAMVLSWNVVVLGLAGTGKMACEEPIKLLLSVNSSALPAVQGFAIAALATSLIGYAVSFPKQLVDTVQLIAQRVDQRFVSSREGDRAGSAVYPSGKMGTFGEDSFDGGKSQLFSNGMNQEAAAGTLSEEMSEEFKGEITNGSLLSDASSISNTNLVMWVVLVVPIFISSFFPAAFSKALDFAGVYANCFLFGVLPPAMAWIHRSRKRYRSRTFKEDLLPGGSIVLAVLFGIAVILGFWHCGDTRILALDGK